MIAHDIARAKLAIMGVVQFHPDQKYQFISKRIKIVYLMTSSFISLSFYVLFEADNLQEYINAIFFLSIQIVASLTVSNCIWNTNEIYRIFNSLESIINNSKKWNYHDAKQTDLIEIQSIESVCLVFWYIVQKIMICRDGEHRVWNALQCSWTKDTDLGQNSWCWCLKSNASFCHIAIHHF